MTRITGDWLHSAATKTVTNAFLKAGFQIYFVGGCVRNACLGVDVSDLDLATNARPDEIIQLASEAGIKAIPTGIEHGTITLVQGKIPYEITTFRHDLITDGRRAKVAFSDTVRDDAMRRDFTMNALYASADGTVHDPVGGLPDLRAGLVRFVGEPQLRIAEDYLRILRFFRFYAWYGDPDTGPDPDGLAACTDGIDGLAHLSRERVGAEMIKLLSAANPSMAIAAMAQTGVLQAICAGADHKALAPLIHFEDGRAPDWRRRAAVLGGPDLKETWRLSKSDARHLETLRGEIGSSRTLAELAYRHGELLALNIALTRAALFETPPPIELDKQIATSAKASFPVKATDIPQLDGRALGEKLRQLESDWIASEFSLTKAQLLAL